MNTARHAHPARGAAPGGRAMPERRTAPRLIAPPPYRRFQTAWSVALALFATSAVALAVLPAGMMQASVEASAAFDRAAGSMLGYDPLSRYEPRTLWKAVERVFGVQEERPVWVPSGVDYGNTRVPRTPEGKPVRLAWQYRPRSLSAVPEGVNVLSPTWFYVESRDGVAEVNALDTLLETKITNWRPGQYIETAHGGGAQVWPSIVCIGTPDLASQIVNDEQCRSQFISRITGWVTEYGLDGVNFDFEKMDPADAEAFTAFVAECKRALPPGKVVSVDVTVPLDNPEGNWWQCYDREGLGRAADYVAVMTYDNPDVEPVAAIGWVSDKLKDMLVLMPSEKLLMGVPFYGVDFLFDAPEGSKLTKLPDLEKSKVRKTMTPSGIRSLMEKNMYSSGGKEVAVDYWIDKGVWDEQSAVTRYAFVDKGGTLHLVYCEDERSLEAKGRLLSFERLGGAAVWRAEFGAPALWAALFDGMAAVN